MCVVWLSCNKHEAPCQHGAVVSAVDWPGYYLVNYLGK